MNLVYNNNNNNNNNNNVYRHYLTMISQSRVCDK